MLRAISARPEQTALLGRRRRFRRRGALGAVLRRDHSPERLRDVVAGFDLVERNAAIDRLAHQPVVVGNDAGERFAERRLDVGAAQAGPEQMLLEAVDDDLRLRPALEALAD